jgi:hypothetical protein
VAHEERFERRAARERREVVAGFELNQLRMPDRRRVGPL